MIRNKPAPEIVAKLAFSIDGTKRVAYPFLDIHLFANAGGLGYLAKEFDRLAKKARNLGAYRRVHEHFDRHCKPFNALIGDDIAFRIELISSRNRIKVLRTFGVSRTSRRKGNMIPHLKQLIGDAEECLRREALTKPDGFRLDKSGRAIRPTREQNGKKSKRKPISRRRSSVTTVHSK